MDQDSVPTGTPEQLEQLARTESIVNDTETLSELKDGLRQLQ
jgi:hypothetical protein